MFQKMLITLSWLKAGNTSKNDVLNDIRQIIYSLYQAKYVIKKLCNHIINSINVNAKMNIIFMNSKNSKTSDSQRLLLNLKDRIGLTRKDKYIAHIVIRQQY